MTRYYDPSDIGVQADKLREETKQHGKWFHKKGLNVKQHKLLAKTRMLRDSMTREDIAFKSDLARREKKTPITLPKLGATDAGD